MSSEFIQWWKDNWGWFTAVSGLLLTVIGYFISSSKKKKEQKIKSGKNSKIFQAGKNINIKTKDE